jgi:MFS family permease
VKNPHEATMLSDSDHPGTLSALPFQLGIVMLGLSAALFGTWVEKAGPRAAMATSSLFFCGGLAIAGLGVSSDQYWLVVIGSGFVGGIGLGIGYISPVSTLIKWFPDRPGLATGIAIMGFGGGALIASPMTTEFLKHWDAVVGTAPGAVAPDQDGIAKTFLALAAIYAIFMIMSYSLIRVPAPGWKPAGWVKNPDNARISRNNVSAKNAIKTPQFWLLWVVLCFNVTAGIGILERAAPIFRDFFPDSGGGDAASLAAAAAGFVAMLSLCNSAGRLGWSTLSDILGRRNMYRIYLGVGCLLYLFILLSTDSNKALFVLAAMLILSFYGAGFATVPAYLKDLFGSYQVGAIHGRLLTAWSVAGVLGPMIINNIADHQIGAGKKGPDIYTPSFIIVIVLLVIAFICNELIKPVDPKWHEPATEEELEAQLTEKTMEASA